MGNSGSRKNVIFVGLMLGMLVAAVSQTIVSPAMPVIVSELGGIEHYSWIATSALLVSAVTVPVDRQALRRLRQAQLLHCGVGGLHAGFHPGRGGTGLLVAGRRPRCSRLRDGHHHAALPDHYRGHHQRPRARQVHGLHRRRLRRRLDRGAVGRRMDHGQLLLALAVLRQLAFRRRCTRVHPRLSPVSRTYRGGTSWITPDSSPCR